MENKMWLIDPSVIIRDLTAMKSQYDAIALDGIIKALKEAPTVDARPVVHGHMEEIEPCQITIDRQCCLCGTPMGKCDNYCPNCGAHMDGGDGE